MRSRSARKSPYLLGCGRFGGITQLVNEATHTIEAGFVEGLKNVEGGEQEGAGATGRVEDCYVFDGFPEGAKQVGTFAVFNDVLGKLAKVQVICDEVIHLVNFAVGQFPVYFMVSLSARHYLTPYLSWQGVFGRGGRVPPGASRNVPNSGGDFGRKFVFHTVFDGVVDVAVGILNE